MRILLKNILLFLFMIFFVSACTFQKRVYMPGYNISIKNSKQNQEKHEFINTEIKQKQIEIIKVEKHEIDTMFYENYTPVVDNLSASVDDKQINIPKKAKNSLLTVMHNNISNRNIIIKKSQLKPDENKPYSGAAIVGFICGLIELLFLILLFSGTFELIVFTIILEVATIMLSIKGLRDTRKGKMKGKAFSIIGLIFGGVLIIIGLYLGIIFCYMLFISLSIF